MRLLVVITVGFLAAVATRIKIRERGCCNLAALGIGINVCHSDDQYVIQYAQRTVVQIGGCTLLLHSSFTVRSRHLKCSILLLFFIYHIFIYNHVEPCE
jgi:hypothetical protein